MRRSEQFGPGTGSWRSLRTALLVLTIVAVVLVIAWYWFVGFVAYAQSNDKLVSNHQQTRNDYVALQRIEQGVGQAFTTGPDREGYWLDYVVVRIERGHESRFIELEGALHEVNSDGSRGGKLFTFTHTGVHVNYANYTFTAPGGSYLTPDTSYMFVIKCLEGCANDNYLRFAKTESGDEDSNSKSGWQLANKFVRASDDWSPASDVSNALVITVRGRVTIKPYILDDGVEITSTPATGITYGRGESIEFSVTFNARVLVGVANGTPELTMQFASANNPESDRFPGYVSGSGTETLLFRYVVQGNDTDATGLRLAAGQVKRRGGFIRHAQIGQPAILTHSGGGSNGNFPSHRVDGTLITPRASLAALQVSGTTLNPSFNSGTINYIARVASRAGVTVSKTTLTILEGSTDTYNVFLTSQPTGNVTVTVNDPTDNTDVTADPATLTFTTTDWNVAQTVTVTVAQDDDAADETATVTHTVSGYGAVATADDVVVTVEDDAPDSLTVSFGAASYSAKEQDDAGTVDVAENQADVTVVLDADPKRTVTVPVAWDGQDGATAADFSGVPISVVFSRGETEKTINFTARTDGVVDDGESVKLTVGTLPTGVTAGTPAEAIVTIDDTTRRTLLKRLNFDGTETENTTVAGEFKVRVHFLPSATGLLQEELEITNGTIVAWEFEARPVGSGTVNAWYVNVLPDEEAPTVTVRVPPDVVDGGNQPAEVTYDTSPPLTVQLTTNVDEPVINSFRVIVTFSAPVSEQEDGAESGDSWIFSPDDDLAIRHGTYVSSNQISSQVWHIAITPAAAVGTTVVTLPQGRVATGSNTDVWNSAASLEVQAGKRSVAFEQTAYTAVESGTVEVKVTLDADPLNTVAIPLIVTDQGGAGADDYSGIPASRTLTFNAGDTEKTFTFSAADDSIDDDGESVKFGIGTPLRKIVKRGSTTESTVSIIDNDTAGVTVSETRLTVTEQGATGDSYTVVLDTQPTANVTVTVAGHSGTDVTPNPTTLTFTSLNWSVAQTVSVTAGDDADTANDAVYLTHSAASTDTVYNGITIAGVTVTVQDNDTAQVTGVMVEPGNAQLVVNWTQVSGATGYNVQWKSGGQTYNTGDRQAVISSGTTTTHTIGSLTNGTEYTARVIATRTGANDGPPSDEVRETPVASDISLCGARLDPNEPLGKQAELDICWEVGDSFKTGKNTVIEWQWHFFWGESEANPWGPWKEVARGDTYTPCTGGGPTCVQHTIEKMFRGYPFTYRIRVRTGGHTDFVSPELEAQAPNSDATGLVPEISGAFLPGTVELVEVPTGPFWFDLVFTDSDPAARLLSVETVPGLDASDLMVTNATATVQLFEFGYKVTLTPLTLGAPVTAHLPATAVKGVGEGITSDGVNNYTRNNVESNTVTWETAEP